MLTEGQVFFGMLLGMVWLFITIFSAHLTDDWVCSVTNHPGDTMLERRPGELGARRFIVAVLFVLTSPLLAVGLAVYRAGQWFFGRGDE